MTHLQRAIADLSAIQLARGIYAYESNDEGRSQWYAVDSADMHDYGRLLSRGQPDAYSIWCSETQATRLGACDDYDPRPTLRARYDKQ